MIAVLAESFGSAPIWRNPVRRLIALASVLAFTSTDSATSPASAQESPLPYWRETFAGADITSNVWLLYSGVTLAPTSEIYADGVRLRATGGYGQYRYSGHRSGDPAGSHREFRATVSYVEALVGYQERFGELTAKAFVGVSAIDHSVSPDDPIASGGLLSQGLDYGVKGLVELWLNIGSDAWTSLDASWTTAHQTYAGRWRIGYRVLPTVSLGAEAAVNGNALDGQRILSDGSLREPLRPQTRAGLFARYEWNGGEISVSSGIANDWLNFGRSSELKNVYGTVNWLSRF